LICTNTYIFVNDYVVRRAAREVVLWEQLTKLDVTSSQKGV